MLRSLRVELATEHGTVQRVARQTGTTWGGSRVRQANMDDGYAPGAYRGVKRIKDLEQDSKTQPRQRDLKRGRVFFRARKHKK